MGRPDTSSIARALLAILLLTANMPSLAAGAKAKSVPGKEPDPAKSSAQWRTATPEELAMTSEPLALGAAAIYLYTNNERSDEENIELIHRQIKVLTDEGRNRANISLNYNKEGESFLRIDARVIQPDGTVVPFSGEIYDRPLVANREVALYARSFTLPDVRVGSVIEYRYWRKFVRAPNARWFLNQDLFTRQARFSLKLSNYLSAAARWSWPTGLPEGTAAPKRDASNVVSMEVRNMPAFVVEDYMPPADDLILSVDFSYNISLSASNTPTEYWRSHGQDTSLVVEKMIGNAKDVRKYLDQIVLESDSADAKVRKIYDHVRRLVNSDEPELPGQKPRPTCRNRSESAQQVGKHGCGTTASLQMYFIALVRAAGIDAAVVEVSSRRERFYSPDSLDSFRFDGLLVAVTLGGRQVLLEPGISILPFGSLTWWKTAVPAFKVAKNGGEWFTTTMPVLPDATIRRMAKLVLSDDGVLEGSVVVRHSGHEAVGRLAGLRVADETARIEYLKSDLQQALAVPAELTVVRQPDWNATEGIIETEYRVKVSQWALSSGNRLMVGIGLYGAEQVGKFVAPKREHPIYFAYPFIAEDFMEITLPPGFQLQNAPARQVSPDNALQYSTAVEGGDGVVKIRRSLAHNVLLAKQIQYPRMRSFYDLVRSGDQEQVVLAR